MLSGWLALHVGAGAVALVSMWVPIVAKKGGAAHVRGGQVFYASLLTAAVAAGIVALGRLAQGERVSASLFLLFVGTLSGVGAVHGRHALVQRRGATEGMAVDQGALVVLATASAFMAGWGMIDADPLRLVFAALGLFLAVPGLRLLAREDVPATVWVQEHLRAMGFAAIGTLTAFLVVNVHRAPAWFADTVPAWVVWTAPGVLGGLAIAWASRRVERLVPPT